MKIKKISTEQFAGLRDRELKLEDGLNIIIGENESGKSTMLDLIYSLFFQEAVLDNRTDKLFRNRYFPKKASGISGDAIDGVIRFETSDGEYKIAKEWSGKDGYCKMTLPDGDIVKDAGVIRETLSKILKYGRGVYDELIFASQKRTHTLLDGILGNSSENVEELAATLTKAVMETGGIEIDEVEKELKRNVEGYEGRWDFSADRPEGGSARGINNKWSKGAGSILGAYYKREEVADLQRKAVNAEKRVKEHNDILSDLKKSLAETEATREAFSRVRELINSKNTNSAFLSQAKNIRNEMKNASDRWPVYEKQLEKAEALKEELELAKKRELYIDVKKFADEKRIAEEEAKKTGKVEPDELKDASSFEKKAEMLSAQLKGMNLSANIKKLGREEINVTSSVSGERIEISGEKIDITEAVKITVAGIVDIELAPKGTDVEAVQSELIEMRGSLDRILKKYDVKNVVSLAEKQRESERMSAKISELTEKIEIKLNGEEWTVLEDEARRIPEDIRRHSEIQEEIRTLCGASVDSFIGGLKSSTDGFAAKYSDKANLARLIETKDAEITALEKKVESAGNIPDEFKKIENSDEYEELLKKKVEDFIKNIEKGNAELRSAERELPERSAEEYSEDLDRANEEFIKLKEEYARWKHILNVFTSTKEASKGNPIGDIEENFRKYLSELSGGNLKLDTIGEDLNSVIVSRGFAMNKDILSEGTKDTVSLAFRLAVLNHLYPEGGCVVVFDDPFTDMDPERTAEACRILQRFAENNQVIFITCDEKYKNLLSGNVEVIA